MTPHACFVGKVAWRVRLAGLKWALRAAWLALRGYVPVLHMHPDSEEEATLMAARAMHQAEEASGVSAAPASYAKH